MVFGQNGFHQTTLALPPLRFSMIVPHMLVLDLANPERLLYGFALLCAKAGSVRHTKKVELNGEPKDPCCLMTNPKGGLAARETAISLWKAGIHHVVSVPHTQYPPENLIYYKSHDIWFNGRNCVNRNKLFG